MNKGRRNELVRLNHKKRADVLGLTMEKSYGLKSQGRPCSCVMCKQARYNRSTDGFSKRELESLMEEDL